METNREDNLKKYISGSKININNYICKNEHRKVFELLIIIVKIWNN